MERILYGASMIYAFEAIQKVETDDLVKAVLVIVGWIIYNLINRRKRDGNNDNDTKKNRNKKNV